MAAEQVKRAVCVSCAGERRCVSRTGESPVANTKAKTKIREECSVHFIMSSKYLNAVY